MKLLLLIVFPVSFSFGQGMDTVSVYFHVDSDRPILNVTTEYQRYETPKEGIPNVIKLEAHCDTTGSLDYNDDLAQRRIQAVKKQLEKDRWEISPMIQERIHSERRAGIDTNYTHDIYRRVDIVIHVKPPSNAQVLTMKLNAFVSDTSTEKSIDLTILFHPGTTNLMQESIPEAKALKDFMLSNASIYADIHGHVCCGKNYDLSLNRAKVITEFLMKQGVDPKRMTYQGHSNSQPKVYPELSKDDEKQNRRVAVVFKKIDL